MSNFYQERPIKLKYMDLKKLKKFLFWLQAKAESLSKTPGLRVFFLISKKLRMERFTLVAGFSLVLSGILSFEWSSPIQDLAVGDVAMTTIRSPVDFDFPDVDETERLRNEARNTVPPVLDWDPYRYRKIQTNIYHAFREFRKLIREKPWPQREAARLERMRDFMKFRQRFEEQIGVPGLSERAFEWLVFHRFDVRIESALLKALDLGAERKIRPNAHLQPEADAESKIVVRVLGDEGVDDEFIALVQSTVEVDRFRRETLDAMDLNFLTGVKPERIEMNHLLSWILVPNLLFNSQETDQRRLRAFEAILPVVVSLKRNQILIPEGAEINGRHIKMFQVLMSVKARDNGWVRHLSRAGVMMVLIVMFLSFMDLFARRSSRSNEHALSTMAVVTVVMVVIGKLMTHFLQRGLSESVVGQIPDVAFQYLLPLAAGPMIVGLLIPSLELSWFFSIFNSVMFGLLVGGDLSFLVVALTGSFVASRGVARVRRRNDIYRAGLRASIVAMLMGALITASQDQESLRLEELLMWNGLLAFGGGMISSIVALSLAPLLESAFGHTTDIRLLELSQLDHPLFKELIMKAPGTYHHCLVVGQLAEAAAEAVGANPLLARVASYYHDVGKSDHPGYFIENHRAGTRSPHDEISPFLSRTIIHAHVKDGVTKARQHRLGKPILDIIEQHHGTTLLNYFYKKARERAAKDGLPEPSEQDFRYPGPKPQFRESAIVMLADSVEAASRSMDDPTPSQLTHLVKSIVQRKFADNQLSECHLTMKDLHLIEASLTKGILGVYHHRFGATSEEAQASNG